MAERMEVRRPKRKAEEELEEVMITLDINDHVTEQNEQLEFARQKLKNLHIRRNDMAEKLELIRKGHTEIVFSSSEFGLTEKDYVEIVEDIDGEISEWEAQVAGMEKERMDFLRQQMENELRATSSNN